MNDAEKILMDIKQDIDNVEVPMELEDRLMGALENEKQDKSFRIRTLLKVAAVLIAVLFVGYNFDTLAFYGKKLIGYDGVMSGPLKQLNDMGKGQLIGKSYTFKNGAVMTLDGIMLDDNKFIAFYSLKNLKGNDKDMGVSPFVNIKGAFGTHMQRSSIGNISKNKTEIKYVGEFETPNFLEKSFEFIFSIGNGTLAEEGKIKFVLDRNKAMGHTLKKNLKTVVKVDETNIRIDSIVASPTSTVIRGTIQNIFELAVDDMMGDRFRPHELRFELIANGKKINGQGGGMSTSIKGITFNQDFDPLPDNLENLKLKLVSFGADHDVNKIFDIVKGSGNKPLNIFNQRIDIKNVYEKDGDTYITITTLDTVLLSKVFAGIDGKEVELKETISRNLYKDEKGDIYFTRTLHFPGRGDKLKLDIRKMTYTKVYNKDIDIPVK